MLQVPNIFPLPSRTRHLVQTIEINNVCRLVTEYNVLMGKLSHNEKGIFRNRIMALDRRRVIRKELMHNHFA